MSLNIIERLNGRGAQELRPLEIIPEYTRYAPGSVLTCFGNTKVLVTASIEERVPRHVYITDNDNEGWLTAEYSLLPAATHTRNQRERQKLSGRTAEIQRLIGRSLRASVDLGRLGQRTITIDADVFQADGGTRVAAITGGFVALNWAIHHLMTQGMLKESPLLSPIAAVSVGILQDHILLDLNYEEDNLAGVDANVVMNGNGELIEFQATSEGTPFTPVQMSDMLEMAIGGIRQIHEAQLKVCPVALVSV